MGGRIRVLTAGALLVVAACTPAPAVNTATPVPAPTTTTTSPPTTAASPSITAAPVPAPTTRPAPPPRQRVVVEQAWAPFATVGGVVLHQPSSRTERIGFHESNHDGARQMEIVPSATSPHVLESRERGTGSQTAADLVSDPQSEIRAPATGRVKRAGGYTLYCDNRDYFVVIEPDAHPGWEVKLLHIVDLRVRPGQRVEAGVTVLASGPRQLPFESQVDEVSTVNPAWPHVHLEVVDPSIPDRPTPGGGC